MDKQTFLSVFFLGAGAFSILGAALDWDWFFNNHRARPIVSLLGRNGARGFYVVLGLALAGFAVARLSGAEP